MGNLPFPMMSKRRRLVKSNFSQVFSNGLKLKTVQNGAYYLRRGENTMQRTLVSSQAWDVPNSSLVVNLKKFHESTWGLHGANIKTLYLAGVSAKSRVSSNVGYSMFNETGEDPYSASKGASASSTV